MCTKFDWGNLKLGEHVGELRKYCEDTFFLSFIVLTGFATFHLELLQADLFIAV